MRLTLLSIISLAIVSCAPQNNNKLAPLSSVNANLSKQGSLANSVLAQDASLAIRKIMGGNAKVIKFVIQKPVGNVGSKAWREVWVYDPASRQQKFILTFREDGQGSADFEIQQM